MLEKNHHFLIKVSIFLDHSGSIKKQNPVEQGEQRNFFKNHL